MFDFIIGYFGLLLINISLIYFMKNHDVLFYDLLIHKLNAIFHSTSYYTFTVSSIILLLPAYRIENHILFYTLIGFLFISLYVALLKLEFSTAEEQIKNIKFDDFIG